MGSMLGGGGGGGTSGGVVVGGPSPGAAMVAGQYQDWAAQAAVQASKDQNNNAINAIRQGYTNAFIDLKPYTQTGVQALDELNSYLGLSAYNPGTAPNAPVKKTLEDFMGTVSANQIRSYVTNNTNLTPFQPREGQNDTAYTYTGYGANELHDVGGPYDNTQLFGMGNIAFSSNGGLGNLLKNGQVQQGARTAVAQDMLDQQEALYPDQYAQYQQQQDMYDYSKKLYDQYSAQGPMTPEQVQAKLAATPGYQFQLGQGVDAIQRAASANGSLGSGRLLQSLVDYGQGMASQTYGDTLSRLAALAGAGQSASSQLASGSQQQGQNIGQLWSNLGDTIANSYLASGNAKAQATLAANQQYQTIGGQSNSGGGGGLGGIGSLLGGLGSFAQGGGLSGLFNLGK